MLYPVDSHLDDTELRAVALAAAEVGDEGFYAVEAGLSPQAGELYERGLAEGEARGGGVNVGEYAEYPAWFIAVNDLRWGWLEGFEPRPVGTTGLVSPSGCWGMLISYECNAVVGGSNAFVDRLTEAFPALPPFQVRDKAGRWVVREPVPPREQIMTFLEDVRAEWKDPMRWLPTNLAHLYGEARASELLHRGGFAADKN